MQRLVFSTLIIISILMSQLGVAGLDNVAHKPMHKVVAAQQAPTNTSKPCPKTRACQEAEQSIQEFSEDLAMKLDMTARSVALIYFLYSQRLQDGIQSLPEKPPKLLLLA